MDSVNFCISFDTMENGPNIRSMKNLKKMWEDLFITSVMESCRKEEDDELTKITMLLKSAHTSFKRMLIECRTDERKLTQELQAEKTKTATLEAEIERLQNESKLKNELSGQVCANVQVKAEMVTKQKANFKVPATNVKNTTSSMTPMDLGITPLPSKISESLAETRAKFKDLGIKPLAEIKKEKQDEAPSTSNMQENTRTLSLSMPENKDISFGMEIDLKSSSVKKTEESGMKRLSSEGDESVVKKVKVESFFVPDTPLDYEVPETSRSTFFVPETLNESQDPFSETILQESAISSDAKSPQTPCKSPILTASPKSPIIRTARSRRILFEKQSSLALCNDNAANISNVSFSLIPSPEKNIKNQSLISPSLLKSVTKHSNFSPISAKKLSKETKSSPSPAKNVLNKLTIISSSGKINPKQTPHNPTPNEFNSNQLLSNPSPAKSLPKANTTFTPSTTKATTKQNLPLISPSKSSSISVKASPKKVEVNGKENKLGARPKVVSSYLNGCSKLEVYPAKKTVKLKQSKLSLSMFQSSYKPKTKKLSDDEMLRIALEESTKPQNDAQREEELLQVALAESMKSVGKPAETSKKSDCNVTSLDNENDKQNLDTTNKKGSNSLDPDTTYFERPESSIADPDKTLFESAKDVESVQTFFDAFEDGRENKQGSKDKKSSSRQQKKNSFLNLASFHEMNHSDIGQFFTDFEEDKAQRDDNLQQAHKNEPSEKVEFQVPKPLNTMEKEYFNCYDKVPDKQKPGPSYAYQAGPVRKKNERQQLPGWECHECKTFCNVLCEGMNSQEKRDVISKCSRHRQKAPVINNTPPGIWEIGLMKSPVGWTQEGELHVKKAKGRIIDKAVAVTQTPCDDML